MDGEVVEEGEVSDATEVQAKYNLDKLVDFPGFNTPVPKGMNDVSACALCYESLVASLSELRTEFVMLV